MKECFCWRSHAYQPGECSTYQQIYLSRSIILSSQSSSLAELEPLTWEAEISDTPLLEDFFFLKALYMLLPEFFHRDKAALVV